MGTFIQWMSGFFAGFAIGFAYGWKLTLVILAISPVLAGVAVLMSKVGAREKSLRGLDSHDLPYLPPMDEEPCIYKDIRKCLNFKTKIFGFPL